MNDWQDIIDIKTLQIGDEITSDTVSKITGYPVGDESGPAVMARLNLTSRMMAASRTDRPELSDRIRAVGDGIVILDDAQMTAEIERRYQRRRLADLGDIGDIGDLDAPSN